MLPFWDVTIPNAQRISWEFVPDLGKGVGKRGKDRSFFMCTSVFNCLSREGTVQGPESWCHHISWPISVEDLPGAKRAFLQKEVQKAGKSSSQRWPLCFPKDQG